jgi:excisionase family DNA binding protein
VQNGFSRDSEGSSWLGTRIADALRRTLDARRGSRVAGAACRASRLAFPRGSVGTRHDVCFAFGVRASAVVPGGAMRRLRKQSKAILRLCWQSVLLSIIVGQCRICCRRRSQRACRRWCVRIRNKIMSEQPGLMTAREVAKYLRVSVRTVWRWTRSGELPPPARRGVYGRVVRWKAADVDEFVRSLPVRQEPVQRGDGGGKRRL